MSSLMRRAPRCTDSFLLDPLEPRLLLAADPITQDHPLWVVTRGAAVVDGLLTDPDWSAAGEVFRTQPTRDDRAVFVRMMYHDAGLFLAVHVDDRNLWADGVGAGAGARWEVEQDDSLTFYFDADNSRDFFFSPADRAFGVNIGAPSDPINRSDNGPVRRFKYVRGDSAGGAPDVNPEGALAPGIAYASVLAGSVNNSSDVDQGWDTEIFLPWAALNLPGIPLVGQTIGMNFSMIQDNAGGARDLADRRSAPERFTSPHFIDDMVWGADSSFTPTDAGTHGPVNYAEVMFFDARSGTMPAPVNITSVTNVSPFGARLHFLAPAGIAGGGASQGHVIGYQIRYSTTTAINSPGAWIDATPFANAFVPRLRGLAETIRISELLPGTTYNVSVRAVDAAGNLGPVSSQASFTTLALPSPGSKGHIIPSPNGRTLQFENGAPFVPVGDHLGVSWRNTRTLYPGLIWDRAGGQFINLSDPLHSQGEDIDAYLAELQGHGVNTMRVYLELQNTHLLDNPGPIPLGTYWLEDVAGDFNPDMQQFLLNLLERAAARGIYLILSPFDTFSYDESFNIEGPWGNARGGPLSTIDHFFQQQLGVINPTVLNLVRLRMLVVSTWVNSSPFKDHLLGYEFLSEWDSVEWTLHPDGGADPGRAAEFRARAQFIDQVAAYVKTLSPDHLVLNSTITHDPRGPVARLNFLSRNFDALTPHLYTSGNEEPINNPQSDKSILPAREMGYFTSYWVAKREDHAPILNGEWGMTRALWPNGLPQYSAQFTQAQDEAIFRTVLWSGLSSGQAGSGLRIAADELAFRGFLLTDAMRDIQLVMSRFLTTPSLALDFTNFNFQNLAGRLRTSSASGSALHAWGVSDDVQGIVYVLQDANVTTAPVAGGQIIIDGLRPDQLVDAEVWSTAPGTTAPLTVVSGLFVATGRLVLDLTAFTQDVAVKFRARTGGGAGGGATGSTQRIVSITAGDSIITFALGPDQQPAARILNNLTGQVTAHDVSSLSGFRGQAVDMTPYTTPDGVVHLALTDTNHHLWILSGNLATGAWSAEDLTALTGFAGVTGDLTTYQPSWGAVHIAALDARGHAINYWWAPAEPFWHFTNLTGSFDGVPLTGGLTGYVSGWDGLNLAGLDANRNLVVYWWAPGIERIHGREPGRWLIQNMTTDFNGPLFSGQLDAYVTPWGGLNVAGVTDSGEVFTYWWAPGLNPDPDRWRITSLAAEASDFTVFRPGAEANSSPFDGSINVFGLDNAGAVRSLRWTPQAQAWTASSATARAGGVHAAWPLASTTASNRLVVAASGLPGDRSVVLFSYFTDSQAWTAVDTDMLLAPS